MHLYYQHSYDIPAAPNLLLHFLERRKIHFMKHTRLRHHSVQYLQNRPLTPCLVLLDYSHTNTANGLLAAPCFYPQNTIPNNRRNQHIDRNIIQQNLRVLQQQHPVVMAANPPVLLPPPLMFFPNPAVLDQLSLVSNGRMIPGVAQDQHFLQQLAPQQAAAGLLQGGGLSLPTRAAGLGLSVNPAFHQQAMAMSSYLEAAQSNPPRQHMMPQVDEELKRKENSIPYSRGDSNATTASSSRTSASTSRTTSSPSPPPHPEQQL